jgi:hypothetical protein
MTAKMTDERAYYGLLHFAQDELHGDTVGDRVLLVLSMPDSLSPMMKAALVSHQGTMRDVFAPFDAELNVRAVEEVTQDECVRICSEKGT